MSSERALQFVDRLYRSGAAGVHIDRKSLDPSWESALGSYVLLADALLILLPADPQQRGILDALNQEVRSGSGKPRFERHFVSSQLRPLAPGQEVVRLSWPNYKTVI